MHDTVCPALSGALQVRKESTPNRICPFALPADSAVKMESL
jgi:hypothetical protein